MRIPIPIWIVVTLLSVSLGCASVDSPQPDRPPNFIVILTDDQGFGDVGIHGNADIRTPTLDRFATEGVELDRFYVEPVCAPTRAALMTGRYHYRSGVVHTSRGGAKMHGDENTIAEMLRGAGYRTGLFGKWHLGDNYPMRPTDQGFEETLWHKSGGIGQAPDKPNSYFDPWLWRDNEKVSSEGYCTDIFFDGAIDFAERHQDEPFFIYLPTNAPHTPLEVADSYWKPYAEAGLDETTARVYGMVENIDQNLERLLARLDDLGLRDNTVVAVISDNGPQHSRYTADLRGLKGTTYEGGIRALSFWQWPDGFDGRRQLDAVAGHVDVAPTLLEWAGVATPPDRPFDGTSLAPLFRGEPIPERTHFSQVHRGLTPTLYQNAAVVAGQYKLVLGPDTFNNEEWSYSDEPPIELYDLSVDPGETHDVADELPALAAELRERYEDWFSDVRATREFAPGVIQIDSGAENPVVLSRYQDSTYVDGVPTSWNIAVVEAGQYELQVETAGDTSATTLHIDVNGRRQEFPLLAGSRSVTVNLPAGPAELDVWLQSTGTERRIPTDNSTLGDVTISRVR